MCTTQSQLSSYNPNDEWIELEGDEATGVELVRSAVEAPLRQLAANAGREGALIVEHVDVLGHDRRERERGDRLVGAQQPGEERERAARADLLLPQQL